MKTNRVWMSLGLAAAALVAAPLGAHAQTAPNYNYIGIGGSNQGFAINGKATVAEHVSLRPAVITDFNFNDDADVNYVLPVTYDFNAVDGQDRLYPFLGGGINGALGNDSTIEFAVTGGADYRINRHLLVNGSLNWAPFQGGGENVSFIAGVGYGF